MKVFTDKKRLSQSVGGWLARVAEVHAPLIAGASIGRMIDCSSCPAVERYPYRVSGAWVFHRTRVPAAALFENLEDGADVSEFVRWFPGVSLDQVRAVLEHAARGRACLMGLSW